MLGYFWAHLDPFWGVGDLKISQNSLPDRLWGHFWRLCPSRLGECDTPLEPYFWWLQEYAIKTRKRSGSWGATAHNVKKTPENGHFETFEAPGGARGVQRVQNCYGALHHVSEWCTQIFVRIRRPHRFQALKVLSGAYTWLTPVTQDQDFKKIFSFWG